MTSMQAEGKNVKIVPLALNYERVFEMRNLAIEMTSGNVPKLRLLEIESMIRKMPGNLGRTLCVFGEPISLKDHLMQ